MQTSPQPREALQDIQMAEDSLSSTDQNTCLVCVEKIDGKERLHAIGPCNHLGVCSLCYLRLRQLMKVDTCVLCKTVMDRVMVSSKENHRPFEEFQIWGDNAGPEFDWDDKCRMFLPKAYNRDFVRPLQEYRCGIDNCRNPKSNGLSPLEKHLREQHKRSFCKVCLKHRNVFLMEQERYTSIELQQHIVSGDPKLGQAGHPRCEFCKTRFYDANQLHDHLVKDHYSCHLCEKQGIFHKYYRDYEDLERHFRTEHYLCEEEECLEKKFIVFADEIDLRAHSLQTHPNRQTQRSIQVNFKVKRSNWDGTGDEHARQEEKKDEEVHEWTYEGEIGEQTQPPEVLAARRAAARQAARDGGMLAVPAPAPPPEPADDFPSLSGRGPRPATGWASLANARPRAEDFPALHGAPGGAGRGQGQGQGRARGGGGGVPSFRTAVEAYPTKAQEIAMSGSGEGGWCFDYPMPPAQETRGAAGGGGGGGGNSGTRRVAGIGNMKLKIDKKAGKKKQKGGGGGGAGGAKQQQQQDAEGQGAEAVAEDFPLAPGMRNSARSPATGRAETPAATGPSLAESIARREQAQQPAAPASGEGGPPSVVAELKDLLGEEAFSEVKELSASYRAGWTMPGEYFKAMQERLPAEGFGEMFEGLVGILPDEDKRREMLVLLAASRSAQAKAAATKKPNRKQAPPPPSATPNAAPSAAPVSLGNGHAPSTAQQGTTRSMSPPEKQWPDMGTLSLGEGGDASKKGKSTRAKGNGKAGGGASNGSGTSASPGSAATWLKAMGTKTGGRVGGTGISVVRPSSRATNATGGAASRGYGSSGLRSAVPEARSESPPPVVPLRRRDQDAGDGGAGIGAAGASWATQGGTGFNGRPAAAGGAGKVKISREDFPGLSSGGGLGSGKLMGRGPDPVLSALAPRPSSMLAPPPQQQQQRPPAKDDFPGLPTPAAAMPGMGKVEWGAAAGTAGGGGGAGGQRGRGGPETAAAEGGKGAKRKNKQKAEKDALKGMAFGFR